jgi:hypothetical protein
VHDLRVGVGVGQPRDLEAEQPPRGSVRGRVRQRERDPLVVHDPLPALLALQRPGGRLLDQPPHRADAARGDAETLLGEPAALQVVAAAQGADDRVVADLDAREAQRRVAVRVAVREQRVVDDLDPRRPAVDQEQRRQLGAVDEGLGHDDVHGGDVAVGDEPLSPSMRQPASVRAAVVAIRDGSEPACSSVTAYASCSSPRSAGLR